jgi:hypothetical protein
VGGGEEGRGEGGRGRVGEGRGARRRGGGEIHEPESESAGARGRRVGVGARRTRRMEAAITNFAPHLAPSFVGIGPFPSPFNAHEPPISS